MPGRILNLLISADIVPLAIIRPNFMPATDIQWWFRALVGKYQRSCNMPIGYTLITEPVFFCRKLNWCAEFFFFYLTNNVHHLPPSVRAICWMGYYYRGRRNRQTIFFELNNHSVLSLFVGEITARISVQLDLRDLLWNVFGGFSLTVVRCNLGLVLCLCEETSGYIGACLFANTIGE